MILDVAEFILARVAEDEAVAEAGKSNQADRGWESDGRTLVPHVGIIHEPAQMTHVVNWDPWRVLAACAAKRRIVELHRNCSSESCGWPCETLCAAASEWAGHEEYEEWWG